MQRGNVSERLHLNCFRRASRSFTNLSCMREESSSSSTNGDAAVIYEPSKPSLSNLAGRKPLMQFVSLEDNDRVERRSSRKRSDFVRQTSDFVSEGSQRIASWFSPRRKAPTLRRIGLKQAATCVFTSPSTNRVGATLERRHSRSLRLPRPKERRERAAYEIVARIPDVIISCHGDYCYLHGSLPNVNEDSTSLSVSHELVRRESSSSIDSEEDAKLRYPARSRRLAIAETRSFGDMSPSAPSPVSFSEEENERVESGAGTAAVGAKEAPSAQGNASEMRRRQLKRSEPLNSSLNSIEYLSSSASANENARDTSAAGASVGSDRQVSSGYEHLLQETGATVAPNALVSTDLSRNQRSVENKSDSSRSQSQKSRRFMQAYAAHSSQSSLPTPFPANSNAHANNPTSTAQTQTHMQTHAAAATLVQTQTQTQADAPSASTKTSDSTATLTNCAASSVDSQPRRILRKMITETEISPSTGTSTNTSTSSSTGLNYKRTIRQTLRSKPPPRSPLLEALSSIKPLYFKDTKLAGYKGKHWTTLLQDTLSDRISQNADGTTSIGSPLSNTQLTELSQQDASCPASPASAFSIISMLKITEQERRRREAVWELFVSELVFLVDHLMVLKHAFIEPLKKMQVDGFLMVAEPHELFGNADELCYVSYTFCRDFMSLLKDSATNQFGPTHIVVEALKGWLLHSRDGEVYHDYCLNYYSAINYLEEMRRHEEFCEYEKWCQADERCRRLQLTDLLAAPMQHCTKIPLLIGNLIKYTQDEQEKHDLLTIMHKIQSSLQQLDEKIKRLFNYDRLRQLQKQIHWPSVMEMNPSCYVPNKLKEGLTQQPCVELLASPKRTLLKEGPVSMIEHDKRLDLYIFLFDDVLLLTKCKKKPSKKFTLSLHKSPTDGWEFKVYKQPIPLDRVCILDIEKPENGLEKHAWVVIHTTRFRQIIGAYTLQAANDATKLAWISFIQDAQNVMLQRMTIDIASVNAQYNSLTTPSEVMSPQKMLARSAMITRQATCSGDTGANNQIVDGHSVIDASNDLKTQPCSNCSAATGTAVCHTNDSECMQPKIDIRRNAVDLTSVRANLLDSPESARPQCLDLPRRSVFPNRRMMFPTVAYQSSSISSGVASNSSDTAAVTATKFTRFCFTPSKLLNGGNGSMPGDRLPAAEIDSATALSDAPSICAESYAFKPLASPMVPVPFRLESAGGFNSASNTLPQSAAVKSDREVSPIASPCNGSTQETTDCRGCQSAVLPKKKISLGEAPTGLALTMRFRKHSKPQEAGKFTYDAIATPPVAHRSLHQSTISSFRFATRPIRIPNIRSHTVGEPQLNDRCTNDNNQNNAES